MLIHQQRIKITNRYKINFLFIYMRTEILFSLVITVILTIFCFVAVVILAMQIGEITQFFKECTEYIFGTNTNNRIYPSRRRRNAIYIPPPPIKEIELTALPKKNFIIIENPDSPYTLGIEHSTE